jgi:hypothetical protein
LKRVFPGPLFLSSPSGTAIVEIKSNAFLTDNRDIKMNITDAGGKMRFRHGFFLVLLSTLVFAGVALAQETEEEILNKFLKKNETKHIQHLGWFSANFAVNRINRHNNYNDFANYESQQFTGAELTWLNTAKALGVEVGTSVGKRFAISVGGEYWLKFGQTLTGTYMYQPAGAAISNPSSKIGVFGGYAGIFYYLMNPPTPSEKLSRPALRIGGTAGYYRVKWDLWPEYQNLNLSTAIPDGSNIAFEGSAPGFSAVVSGEYPLKFHGLSVCAELNYLYLNFKNVAWYNSSEQAVVATYGGTPDTRVNLTLSGVRAKFEVKKFFSW